MEKLMEEQKRLLRYFFKRKDREYFGRAFYNINRKTAEAIIDNLDNVFDGIELNFTYLLSTGLISESEFKNFENTNSKYLMGKICNTPYIIDTINNIIAETDGWKLPAGIIPDHKSHRFRLTKEKLFKAMLMTIGDKHYYLIKKKDLDNFFSI